MKLEVGKTYLNRAGEPILIIECQQGRKWPYRGSKGYTYTEAGLQHVSSAEENEEDLVREVTYSVPAVETSGFDFDHGHGNMWIDSDGRPHPVPQVLSFRDQLARDLVVAHVACQGYARDKDISDCFDVAEAFIAEAKKRG